MGDPFIKLIVYLLLVALAVWVLRYSLTQMRVPDPPNWIATLIIGILLLLLAFRLSGIAIL